MRSIFNLFRKRELLQLSYSVLDPESVAAVHIVKAKPYDEKGFAVTVGAETYRCPTVYAVVVHLKQGGILVYDGLDAYSVWEHFKGNSDEINRICKEGPASQA